MEIRQVQELKLLQKVILTPQLQQAIRLLQLSRAELVEEIRSQLESNPVLEEDFEGSNTDNLTYEDPVSESPNLENFSAYDGVLPPIETQEDKKFQRSKKDIDWENFVEGYRRGGWESSVRLSNEEFPTIETTVSRRITLTEHLLWQIRLLDFDTKEREIAAYIVGNLDDDGYLVDVSLEEISEKYQVSEEEAERILKRLQELDPVGVGARDLKECLLIQARVYHPSNHKLALLIENHLKDLEKKDYQAIAKGLNCTLMEVHLLVDTIRQMEPKPGRAYSSEEPIYIQPDVYVIKVGDEYITLLNEDGLPKLKIGQFYEQALLNPTDEQTKEYVQEKLKSAMWLIRSIHQRQNTVRRVTESIVKFQREFLDKGVEYLRPLVLREVADDIGVHESTVSRVTTNKYVHTPRGIFELKYFFNNHIGGYAGEDFASEAIKSRIKSLIKSEDPRNPLSDQQIVDILKKERILVARRTVAKYRESLGILSANKRRHR